MNLKTVFTQEYKSLSCERKKLNQQNVEVSES